MSDLEAQVCAILNVMVAETVVEMSKIIGGSEKTRTEVTSPPCGTENTEESPNDKLMQFSSFMTVLAQEVLVKICQLFNQFSSAPRLEGSAETDGEEEEAQSDDSSERKMEMEDLQGLTGVETETELVLGGSGGIQAEVEVLSDETSVLMDREKEPETNVSLERKSCRAVAPVDCGVKPSPVFRLLRGRLNQDRPQIFLIKKKDLAIIQASSGPIIQASSGPDQFHFDLNQVDDDGDDYDVDDDYPENQEKPESPADGDPDPTTESTLPTKTRQFVITRKRIRVQKEKTLSCQHCSRMFSTVHHLKAHQVVHEAKTFVCSQCGKTFSLKRRLNDHMLLHTGERPHVCDVCGKSFTLKHLLATHQHLHNKERTFQCEECGKMFHLRNSLKRHQKVHTGERRYSCSHCSKRFTLVCNLQRHLRIHTGEKPYECAICGKSFNQRNTLKSHQRSHTGERPFICETCGKSFIQSSQLKSHRRIVHSEQKLTCDLCSAVMICIVPPQQDDQTHAETIPCVSCGHQLSIVRKLRQHKKHEVMKHHADDERHSCSVCDKSFKSSSYMKIHMRVHSGERFSCETCGRLFTQKCSLKAHQVVHTGQKPFSCSTCGKRFTHYANLSRHRLIHTGEKPYSCDTCGRSFNQSCSLKAHQHIHTGEKPYTCYKCEKSFAYPRSLKEHKCV